MRGKNYQTIDRVNLFEPKVYKAPDSTRATRGPLIKHDKSLPTITRVADLVLPAFNTGYVLAKSPSRKIPLKKPGYTVS